MYVFVGFLTPIIVIGPLHAIIFFERFCYRACALARQTERDRETESNKSLLRGDGHATIPSPPFSSWDLGHACTSTQHEFKPPGLGLEPWSTMWESSDITITLTADHCFLFFFFKRDFFLRDFRYRTRALARQTERDRETESEKSPTRGDGHAAIPSPPFSSRDLGHARTCARREF